MQPSIIQPWAAALGLRHQGVLLAAVRGPDGILKDDPIKHLQRYYRGVLLVSHSGDAAKAASFMYAMNEEHFAHACADVIRSMDHYNVHYLLHFIHAVEIAGYKAGAENYGPLWRDLYLSFTKKLHVNPETEAELDARLGCDEETFRRNQAETGDVTQQKAKDEMQAESGVD